MKRSILLIGLVLALTLLAVPAMAQQKPNIILICLMTLGTVTLAPMAVVRVEVCPPPVLIVWLMKG